MIEPPQVPMPTGHLHPRVGDEMISAVVLPLLDLVDDVVSPLDEYGCDVGALVVSFCLTSVVTTSHGEDFPPLLVLENSLAMYSVFLNSIRRML